MTQDANEPISYRRFMEAFLTDDISSVSANKAWSEFVRARITPILAEDPAMTNAELARRAGLTYASVSSVRYSVERWVLYPGNQEQLRLLKRARASERAIAAAHKRCNKPNRQTREEMYRRYAAGDSMHEISRDNGISRGRVEQLLRTYAKRTGAKTPKDIIQERQIAAIEQAERAKMEKQTRREERDEQILRLSRLGLTQAEIGGMLGISHGTVAHVLIQLRGRTKSRSPNATADMVRTWRAMVDAGISQGQIAKQTGYAQSSISNALRRNK